MPTITLTDAQAEYLNSLLEKLSDYAVDLSKLANAAGRKDISFQLENLSATLFDITSRLIDQETRNDHRLTKH